MGPRVIELEGGRRIDLVTLTIHSLLIFASTFLLTIMGTSAAATLTRSQSEPTATLLGAVLTAGLAAAVKVVSYLATRTGAPIDGAAPPPRV